MRKLYWNNDAFSSTCKFDYIKTSYYWQKNVCPSLQAPALAVMINCPSHRSTLTGSYQWGLSRTSSLFERLEETGLCESVM